MNFESTPLRIASLFLYLSISVFMYHGPRWLVPGRGWCGQVRLVARGQDSHATGRSRQSYHQYIFCKYRKYHKYHSDGHVAVRFGGGWQFGQVGWHHILQGQGTAVLCPAVKPCFCIKQLCDVFVVFSGGPDNSTCHPALDVETQSRWQRECRLPHWGAWVQQTWEISEVPFAKSTFVFSAQFFWRGLIVQLYSIVVVFQRLFSLSLFFRLSVALSLSLPPFFTYK